MALKEDFERIAQAYVSAFCAKHEFDEDVDEVSWIANKVGDILVVNDYFIGYKDIRLDIDSEVAPHVFWDWYDYNLTINECTDGVCNCSYEDYISGKRPYSDEQIENFEQLKENVEEAKRLLEEAINNAKLN